MSVPSREKSSPPVSRTSTGAAGPGAGATDLVAGYRVLRRSVDRHGGHVRTAVLETGGQGDGGDSVSRTAVTIVTFDPAAAEERSMRLIERLERLAAPGVPRVLDVVADVSGPAVVLEFCGDSIASILAGGAEITAGRSSPSSLRFSPHS